MVRRIEREGPSVDRERTVAGARRYREDRRLDRLRAMYRSVLRLRAAILAFVARHRLLASIVEVGTWLGAGTAQLALGIRERARPSEVALHCYDRWQANRSEITKAAGCGVHLAFEEDTLPRVRRTLEPFGVPVEYHKGELLGVRWDGGPISVYVDDAAKMPEAFLHALRTFGPSWVPGTTRLVFMDYDYWRTGILEHRCQKAVVESNAACFERLEHIDLSHAVFRYMGAIEKVPIEVASMALRQVRQRLRACHDSISWRITAPLRTVSNAARRMAASWRRSSA